MQDKIKSYIFTSCKSIFTSLDMGLLSESDLELVATSNDENKLILKKIDDNELMGQIWVQLFIEFYLGKRKYKNPCFDMNLDFTLERAEVLSFESDLFPKIKLNV